MKRLLLLLLTLAPAVASAQITGDLFISEFDPDTPGVDTAEFVELYAPDDPSTALTGYVLVFFNGNGAVSYARIDLDSYTTDANGFVVINQADFPENLQNGDDGLAIYTGDAADFPNGTAPTTTNLIDAVVYSQGNQSRSTALLAGLGETVQYDEGFAEPDLARTAGSFQRLFLGGVGTDISKTFYVFTPTPGAVNPTLVTVDETAAVEGVEGSLNNDNDQGWRMLAMPGFDGAVPFTVDDLADINLVQGISAGATNPAQYAGAGANLLTTASGESTQDLLNSFAPPADTDEDLLPGAGFFWYFYDLATSPLAGGTSFSRDLADPAFSLSLDVNPPDPFIDAGEYDLSVPAVQLYNPPGNPTPSPDPTILSRFYLIGNPYAYPYALGGITPTNNADASVIQNNVYIWNPTVGTSESNSVTIKGSYEIRTADTVDPFAGQSAGRFNGFFVELATNSDNDINFAIPSGFQRPRIDAGTVAKTAVEGRLSLTMEGTTTSGEGVLDTATLFRFTDDATFEWDRFDGTNVTSMYPTYAFIAPIGVNNGNPWAQAVYSMPKTITEAHSVPMAFAATEAGTFTITWDASLLPAGWNVTLRDNEAGTSVDLGTADRYEFTADATNEEWEAGAERFTVIIAPSSVVSNEPTANASMTLSTPMPNPASGVTRVVLSAGASESVRVSVYDALGREVSVLRDGPMASGDQATLGLDTTTLAAGVYVIRAQGENGSLTQRLTVSR